ncbi:MAG: hypothetical protein GTO18_02945 [Anaerolineales bacterium]|nr:hypothetical protein [Anaerolineales bacterium]
MEINARISREFTRFVKFCIVGVTGAIADFGTFNLLTSIFGVWSVAASVISFIAAVTNNFIWNYFWVYPDSRSKPLGLQVVQFTIVSLTGLAIRTPIFALGRKPFINLSYIILDIIPSSIPPGPDSLLPMSATKLGWNLSLSLAVIVVLFWNFIVNRIWTYSDVE